MFKRTEGRDLGRGAYQAWDVFLDGELIDTVFWDPSAEADEVKRSLVRHDGYDPDIVVRKERRKRPT